MLSSNKNEDEEIADLAERVESIQTPVESSKGVDLLQVSGPTKSAKSGLPEARPTVKAVSTADVPQSGIMPEVNLPASGSTVDTGAEQPIAGEYPQGKGNDKL
jgi:hypothetical protein